MLHLFITIFTISSVTWAKKTPSAQNLSASVISCVDGDTCRMRKGNKILKVRFSGIDAPELKQPEGRMAKKYLENKIVGQQVELTCNGKSYERITCVVYLAGTEINEDLVRNGFALDSPKYSKGKYKIAMQEARSKKIGIWKTLNVSPFCSRHTNNKKCAADSLYSN